MLETSGIPVHIATAMRDRGYEKLTPVQEEVSKESYSGLDLLVSAQTGSGKTIAFGFVIVDNLLNGYDKFKVPQSPEGLIIVPTRELALQVKNELSWLLSASEAKIVSCVGGMDIRAERRNLETKPNIVVGTPGRLRDHIKRKYFDVSRIKTVVLDEADEMLDMGFREDLEAILDITPDKRQTLMFSATVSKDIANLAKRYQKDAVRISIGKSNAQHVDIDYRAYKIVMSDQENAIINTLRYFEATNAIIFCATRVAVNHMTSRLTNRGISAVALSGDLSQNERNLALQAMRTSRARVCVATDVAARGLDLPNLDLVIHADIPRTSDTLLHRSGRTGRAGRKGVCAVLVPHNRSRMAERLFIQANIKPTWSLPPSREEILKEDRKRIIENKIFKDQITDDEKVFVDELITKNNIEQLAVAYYRLISKNLSAPEDLLDVTDKKNHNSSKNGFEDSVWFELSVGKEETAEPRWLVAMLCKAGSLSKRDIGSIKIQPKLTLVEISEPKSDKLKALAKDKKPIERHIMIKVLKKPPELTSSSKESGNRFQKRKNKTVFKDTTEDTPKGFRGKRKSERWKNSERRRTKQKTSTDNLKDKTKETSYPKNNNKKQLSRRKKPKNSIELLGS